MSDLSQAMIHIQYGCRVETDHRLVPMNFGPESDLSCSDGRKNIIRAITGLTMSIVKLDFSSEVRQDRLTGNVNPISVVNLISERELTRKQLAALISAVGVSCDRQAFALLYEYYAPRLKSFGLKQGVSAAKAEELVQETMLMVWRKAESFDQLKGSPSNWIFTIMRNKRIDMFRRQRHPEYELDETVEIVDTNPHPDALVATEQEGEALRKAVRSLPENQIEIIQKAFFEDMSHGDVAKDLGLPLGTVKSRIRLAMKRLRLVMEQEI